MTVQCAILSLRCEIFASDEGVTTPDGKKYDGVQKIFKISDTHPAKVMINGNMEFENIPMETIINEFKKKINIEELQTIEEIKNELIKFIREYTPHSSIEEYLSYIVYNFKEYITAEIEEYGFENVLVQKNKKEIYSFVKNYSNFEHEFKDIIPKNKNTEKCNTQLWKIFCHELRYKGTGIILAGYNIDSPYPSFIELNIHCNSENEIIYEEIESKINFEDAIIRIYAMNEEGYAFFTGANEEFIEFINYHINKTNDIIVNKLIWKLKKEGVGSIDTIIHIIKKILTEEYSDLNEQIDYFKLELMHKTSESIEFIPNNLLCTLADEIIRLTAIKQKISSEDENVSMNSHISLITKSNGFQWIKHNNSML